MTTTPVTATSTMTTAEVMAEAVTRVGAARDAASDRGDIALALEVGDLLDDVGYDGDVHDIDRAVPVVFAALLGVTLSEQ